MSNEERKGGWLRVLGIIVVTFLVAFLAFFAALEFSLHRMMDPVYHAKRIEKMMRQEQRKLENFEDKMMENPFEPKMQPMLVNLVKENDEYKVIVDLRPLGGDDKNIKVNLENNVISVYGDMEKKEHRGEEIMSFAQSYYLDENLIPDKMTKEKKGDKYIVTIPFKGVNDDE